jgi:hypothetical protein
VDHRPPPCLALAPRALNALELGLAPRDPRAQHHRGPAIDDLLEGNARGAHPRPLGTALRPSTIRATRPLPERYVKPAPAAAYARPAGLSEVRRRDVQDLIEELRGKGLAASSIHNKLDVLRVVFRRALQREDVAADPFTHLQLPAIRRGEREVADPERAEGLLDAMAPTASAPCGPPSSTPGCASPRPDALRWSAVDFGAGELPCAAAGTTWRASWTTQDRRGAPRDPAGRAPAHRAGAPQAGHRARGGGPVLRPHRQPRPPTAPPSAPGAEGVGLAGAARQAGQRRWVKARKDALDPLTPHEARPHLSPAY